MVNEDFSTKCGCTSWMGHKMAYKKQQDNEVIVYNYSASALLAMQTAVKARPILPVCPSVGHVPVLCPDE